MGREDKAREGAQRAIPDDTIDDVALVFPSGSTMAGAMGSSLGMMLSSDSGSLGAWSAAGSVVGERMSAEKSGMPLSIVLAVSSTTLYALARDSSSTLGSWGKLRPMLQIDRQHLKVTHQRRGVIVAIDLMDTTTGTSFQVESQQVGNLGIGELLETLDPQTGA